MSGPYPTLTRILAEISGCNNGATVDEWEEMVEGMTDEEIQILADGEEQECAALRDRIADRYAQTYPEPEKAKESCRLLMQGLHAWLNLAFDGPPDH